MDRQTYSSYSVMGTNIKLCNDKYCMDERNVYATWMGMCEKNEDVIRVCMRVKELVDMRDKYVDGWGGERGTKYQGV